MKNLFLSFVFLSAAFSVQAQATNTYPASGNVGLGTLSPGANLDVYSEGSNATMRLTSNRTGGADSYYEYKNKTSAFPNTRLVVGRWNSLEGRLSVALGNGSANPVEKFFITQNGNVGIGVFSPLARLEVSGTPNISTLKLDYDDGAGLVSRATFGGHGFQSFSSYNGAAGEPRFVFSKTRGSIDKPLPVQYGDDLGAIWWTPSNDKGSYNHAAKINVVAVGAQTNGITPSRIDFSTTAVGGGNLPSVRMSINHDGNVGIGITAPGRYKLNVWGPVRAHEVVVNTSGADFVFADDYNLPSLQQVESFIKENRHLPEIPSAAEMQENGLHLAEMNIRLLQKVEELTLYMIEQQKHMTEQQNQIQELQSEVSALRKRK